MDSGDAVAEVRRVAEANHYRYCRIYRCGGLLSPLEIDAHAECLADLRARAAEPH